MKPVTRIQQNLVARNERRVLTWLCSRLPAWVTPDQLTGLGMAGAAMVFVGYAVSGLHATWLWLAVAGFVVNWFGDSLDGSLARYRRIERPSFGYFIDHSADGLGTVMIMAGLGLSPFVRLNVALFALIGYLLLSIHAFLAAKVVGEFRLSYLAAGPTELRLFLISLTLAMMVVGPGARNDYSGFDMIIGVSAVILLILFVVQTLMTAHRLAVAGPRLDAPDI